MKFSTDLIGGPYRAPRCRVGSRLTCARYQGEVIVTGMSDAPVPWPLCRPTGHGRPSLVLCGDLETAVMTESAAAVMYHWRVCESTVILWRRILEVTARQCPGTRAARSLRAGTYSTAGHRQPRRGR